jgi:8-oxo-dGTP pyrophosphatase MutT (NUDIX family)
VVLARASPSAPELFMVQRHAATVFGESYAFPGGLVDEEDRAAHACCGGRSARAADRLLNVPGNGLDYFSAAATRGDWAFQDRQAQRTQLREQLVSGERRWSQLLREYRLQLACEDLHYIGHWETPRQLPKRFSARFFVAAMPAGQHAQHDAGELTDGRWISAVEVLALARENTMQVRFPTLKNLQLIAQHESLPALLDWAASCAENGIECIRPELIEVDGQPRPVLPGDPGYPLEDGA